VALDFTTLARAKAYMDIPSATTTNDATIQAMITAVSATLENSLNRSVKTEAKTERRSVSRTGRFVLHNGPATSITSVKYSASGLFARDAVTLDPSSYELDAAKDVLAIPDLRVYTGQIEVAYVGGMAADTASLLAAYPVLDQACMMQVAYLWARRKTPGRTSADIGNGSTQWIGDYDLLDAVVAMLLPLRRPWTCFA
jgi:uncharacterized phiE125 gp8 family phage protein